MKIMRILLAVLVATGACRAQQSGTANATETGAGAFSGVANLPVARIGADDLIGLTVYDSPEFTRTIRVSAEGDIRLPMVKQHIHAAGLYPEELENALAAVLTEEHILVDPVVTVTMVEYKSRPITVAGAVKSPVTFQAMGNVTLLDAISKAGGLAENAGSEILVSHEEAAADGKPTAVVQRIPVHGLLDAVDPALNLSLASGDEVRVPQAGKVYVFGDVKKPGFFYLTDDSQSSVMLAVTLSEGLDQSPRHVAYIYRADGEAGGRKQIPVELKKIMDHKSPDVALMANDILYIPNANGREVALKVLEASLPLAIEIATLSLYVNNH